jgi:pimeloyl-ACP methyl ester carboxylesterase
MNGDTPSDIVLIHGLWMTPRSWENWAARYEQRGHRVTAPAWPGLEVEVEELRRDPTPLTQLSVTKIADHYDRIIRELDSPPIVMGHSMGGMITQLLVDRGLASAAVGVAAATVRGVLDLPSPKQFHYAFCNTMSRAESDQVYERYYVPSANRVLFEVGLANLTPRAPTKVDFTRDDRAPLLFAAFVQKARHP